MSVDFCSAQEWIEAGSPLDKSFVARRTFDTLATHLDFSLEQWCAKVIDVGCGLLEQLAKHYYQENNAASFSIIQRPDLVLGEAWIKERNGHNFTIISASENGVIEIQVSAIITLHSEDQ